MVQTFRIPDREREGERERERERERKRERDESIHSKEGCFMKHTSNKSDQIPLVLEKDQPKDLRQKNPVNIHEFINVLNCLSKSDLPRILLIGELCKSS